MKTLIYYSPLGVRLMAFTTNGGNNNITDSTAEAGAISWKGYNRQSTAEENVRALGRTQSHKQKDLVALD